MSDDCEVYNNGYGWRISFPFQGTISVLTIEEVEELINKLKNCLKFIYEKNQKN